MLCNPAQYLLRCDDLCPTVSARRWKPLAALISEFGLRPILALVPENRDPELEPSPADPRFWDQMREMEAAGAAIALHGYRHLCASRGRSLVGLARRSEFAGVDEATQRQWICRGLKILRAHGLHPRLWVAPRHGSDRSTLRALKAEGIELVSDGLAREPFVRYGALWIPQQLWAPRARTTAVPELLHPGATIAKWLFPQEKATSHDRRIWAHEPWNRSKGLWTICIHPNTAGDEEVEALRLFVRDHAAQFTSVDRVLAEFPRRPIGAGERVYEALALGRIRIQRWRTRLRAGR